MKINIEFGLCVEAVGISYQTCPFWKSNKGDPRPMLVIDIYWKKVWITLPWNHAEPLGNGSAVRSWGFWWKPFQCYMHINRGFKVWHTSRAKRLRRNDINNH